MRPLSLLLGCFLRFVVSDLLWGCEPNCPITEGTRPQLRDKVSLNESWFLLGSGNQTTPVSIRELTEKLFGEGKYGLMVLESGSDFTVQWILSSSSQTVAVSGLVSSKLSNESLVYLSPGVYSIDSSLYSGEPRGIVLVSPAASISFKLKISNVVDCFTDGFLFTIFSWESVPSQISRDITFINPKQCLYCPSLPISRQYIRLCPRTAIMITTESTTIATRETLPAREVTSTEATVESSTMSTTTISSTQPTTVTIEPSTTSATKVSTSFTTTKLSTSQTTEISSTTTETPSTSAPTTTEQTTPSTTTTVESTTSTTTVEPTTSTTTVKPTTSTTTMESTTSTTTVEPTTSIITLEATTSTITTTTTTEILSTTTFIETPTTTSTRTETSSITAGTGKKKITAVFHNNLEGIRIQMENSFIGLVNCSSILQDLYPFGNQPSCSGDGKGVDIIFGNGATLTTGGLINVKTHSYSQAIYSEKAPSPIRPLFLVEYKKIVMRCEKNIEFNVRQVAGTGNRNATFEWNLVDGSPVISALQDARNKRFLIWPTNMVNQNLTINLTVCNFAFECSNSGNMTVQVVNDTQSLSLSMEGIPNVAYPSVLVKLSAVPQFSSCNEVTAARETQYNWDVNGTNVFDSFLRIPAFKYSVEDTVPIYLQATFKDPKSEKLYLAEIRTHIFYTSEPLVLTIDSARRIHPWDADLNIDASASRDPNSANSVLTHSWSCINQTSNQSCVLPKGSIHTSPVFHLPGRSLEKGGAFLFVDNIKSSLGQSGTVSSQVMVSSAFLPSVEMIPMINQKHSVHDYTRILALISSGEAPTNVTWEVVKARGYGFFNLKDFLPDSNINFNIISNGRKMLSSLTIPPKDGSWTGLFPNSCYLLRITATNPKGSSSADVEIATYEELPQGIVEVIPLQNLTGLSSDITLRLGDGWNSLSIPVSYRFGYRILMLHNNSVVEWFPRTSSSSITIVLPSAGPNATECSNRTGLTALVEACDRIGACRVTESEPFIVNAPKNITIAINDVIQKINSDIANGNILDAVQKIWAIEMELCHGEIDISVADRTVLALLHTLSTQSDIEEWKEVLEATSHVLSSVSDDVLLEVQPVLQRYRTKMGLNSVTRKKRDTNMVNLANNSVTSEKEASDMLDMYDVLLSRNQKVADVYLANINDFLAGFCLQLDEQSTRVLKATGDEYTQIQSQAVNPSKSGFLNTTVIAAGSTYIRFTNIFEDTFKEWSCGNNLFCHHICLATARVDSKAFRANTQLTEHFYPQLDTVNVNQSVSSLYKVSIVDPTTGRTVSQLMSISSLYSIRIPITGYNPANYYACFIYMDSSSSWSTTACTANTFGIKLSGTYYMTCNCSTSGYIGVYSQLPPPPPPIPLHKEVDFTFVLNTTEKPKDPQMVILQMNFAATGQTSRLKNWTYTTNNESLVVVQVTLRPPFKVDQITTAYAVQAILRVVDPQSGFVAYDNVRIISSSYEVVDRPLVGDGDARKMIVRIDKSYNQVVGNNSDTLATKWTDTIANALRISTYRFKNAGIFMGIMFNFTITKPFEEEKLPLSAEEISIMLLESTYYGELQVTSSTGESITLPALSASQDIVELKVLQQTNPLVIILLVGIFSGVLLTTLYIGGAVVVKVRTDRCLEEERRRVVLRNTSELQVPPQYGEAVSVNNQLLQTE